MAKIVTNGIGLNPAAELEEWRRILACFGKKLPKSRYKIINGYVHYHGTIDILTLYWNGDLHVARKKSSLNGERFKGEKCFEGSRRSAERFAEGNRLASKLYALVEEDKKVYSLFCFLKKKAILLIKEGKSIEEAEAQLMDDLKDFNLLVPNNLKTEKKQVPSKPMVSGIAIVMMQGLKTQKISNLLESVIIQTDDTG